MSKKKKTNQVDYFCGKDFLIEVIPKAMKYRTFLICKGQPNVKIKTHTRHKFSLTLWDVPFKEPSAFALVNSGLFGSCVQS